MRSLSYTFATAASAAVLLIANSASAAEPESLEAGPDVELASADVTAQTPAAESPPPPPRVPKDTTGPKNNGKGLIIGAGIAGGAAVALTASRVAWYMSTCRSRPSILNTETSCVLGGVGDSFLSIPSFFINLGAIGMAAGGGTLRGEWEAHDSLYGSRRKRKANKFVITGATLIGVGIVGYVSARISRLAVINCVGKGSACYRGVYSSSAIGIQLSMSAVGAGAGLLAFGDQYKRKRRYKMSISPQVTREYAGLSLSGRF